VKVGEDSLSTGKGAAGKGVARDGGKTTKPTKTMKDMKEVMKGMKGRDYEASCPSW
jgi:hypothetical protein